ncbi:MAG: hypothetical protein MUF34_28715 [Polyangiaceae bacterium]|nr:hypothetical protein [Polyangiaceae bacterium]
MMPSPVSKQATGPAEMARLEALLRRGAASLRPYWRRTAARPDVMPTRPRRLP